jgi:fermentation-respiration switch protein FrsA (DUF1100 family)
MAASAQQPTTQPRRWYTGAGRALRWFVIGYLVILLALMLLENRLVYLPWSADDHWTKPLAADWQDVYLDSDDGTRLHAWWCPCAGAEGVLLYCHGNGGNLSHRGGHIRDMHKELKASVLIFDYPGYGKSGGSPSEAGCYAAGETAYRWLTQEKKIPGEKILLFGKSLGGGIATHLGVKYPHRALILCKTFTSVADVAQGRFPWLPVYWLARNRFDSLSRIQQCTQPVFITHGTHDEAIPYSHGEALYQAANEPKCFLPIQDGDHNAPLDREFYQEVRSFLADAENQSKATAAK